MSEIAPRPSYLRGVALFIWSVTLFNVGLAVTRDDVSTVQVVMVVCLAFASGMYAAWMVGPPRARS